MKNYLPGTKRLPPCDNKRISRYTPFCKVVSKLSLDNKAQIPSYFDIFPTFITYICKK